MKTPVLIAAHNEESQIGITLRALPRTAEPIVITNGCEDRTAAVARSFGAQVIEREKAGKMSALQAAIKTLGARAVEPFVTLDADTTPLFGRQWLEGLMRSRGELDSTLPAVVAGSLMFDGWFGAAVRTARHQRRQYHNRHNPIGGGFSGANLLFHAQTTQVVDELLSLPEYWPGEDEAMKDTLVNHGAQTLKTQRISTLALTDNERSGSLLQRLVQGREAIVAAVHQSYLDEAPEGSIYYVPGSLLNSNIRIVTQYTPETCVTPRQLL